MNNKNKGFILISVLLLLGISSMLILSSSSELLQHTKIVSNQQDYIRCFYTADGALMRFRQMLKTTPDFAISSGVITSGDSILGISKSANSLSATAECKNSHNILKLEVPDITLDAVSPEWTVQ